MANPTLHLFQPPSLDGAAIQRNPPCVWGFPAAPGPRHPRSLLHLVQDVPVPRDRPRSALSLAGQGNPGAEAAGPVPQVLQVRCSLLIYPEIPTQRISLFLREISQVVRDHVGPRPERDPGDGRGFHVAGRAAALARVSSGGGVVVGFDGGIDETGTRPDSIRLSAISQPNK